MVDQLLNQPTMPISEVIHMAFNPEIYPSWQKAGEYLVDSDRAYVGQCKNGTPCVFLEDDGVLYPLRQITHLSTAPVDWTTSAGTTRLALSILLDATWGDIDLCEKLYKAFAQQVLTGLSEDGWRLRRDFVWAWIRLTLI
ncbi:MAG: DUF6166 domain-containing protein [Limnochordia bacterium]|jgi:hypothetical protein